VVLSFKGRNVALVSQPTPLSAGVQFNIASLGLATAGFLRVNIGPFVAQAEGDSEAAGRDSKCENNLDTPCVRTDNTVQLGSGK
jgi:hypothetical protein